MNPLLKVLNKLQDEKLLFRNICLIIILLIIFLLYLISPVYMAIIDKMIAVIKPFVIGFMIAYILEPCVNYLRAMGLKRNIAVIFVYLSMIFLTLVILGVLFPALIGKLSEISSSLVLAAQNINIWLIVEYRINLTPLFNNLIAGIRTLSDNLSLWQNAFSAISNVFSYFTSSIIYVVISLYMINNLSLIKTQTKKISKLIHPFFPSYLSSLDYHMMGFLRGMLILMGIRLVEYGVMYFIVGHSYFKEIAILSAVSILVPYLGLFIASIVGILTGFGLPTLSFWVMTVLTLVLFGIDTYVIMPRVYSIETNTHPIWILFAIVTGINLFGIKGLVFAVPLLLVCIVAYHKILGTEVV